MEGNGMEWECHVHVMQCHGTLSSARQEEVRRRPHRRCGGWMRCGGRLASGGAALAATPIRMMTRAPATLACHHRDRPPGCPSLHSSSMTTVHIVSRHTIITLRQGPAWMPVANDSMMNGSTRDMSPKSRNTTRLRRQAPERDGSSTYVCRVRRRRVGALNRPADVVTAASPTSRHTTRARRRPRAHPVASHFIASHSMTGHLSSARLQCTHRRPRASGGTTALDRSDVA